MIGRRGFITGLVSLVAAPAIVRVASIMPVKVMIEEPYDIGPMINAFLDAAHRQINPAWLADLGAFGTAITFDGVHVPLAEYNFVSSTFKELFDEHLAEITA